MKAFILYRQHHQANVVSQNPGLANPEISKIIGEQWQSQPVDVKYKWKALAEEEKLRHQQQYPTYRYQPKRNGRRNSVTSDAPGSAGEKPKCTKCGGRSILAPSTAFAGALSTGTSPSSVPQTPGSAATPISRTLPVLKDLSLQSPAARRLTRQYHSSEMSPSHHAYADERDDLGPLSPETKRRRFNGDPPPLYIRAMPPRYGNVVTGVMVGPGTPIPWNQPPSQPHHYPQAMVQARRESLPGLRGMISPGMPAPMPPPPRPGMGYQQHRLSQGHIQSDRSLTLPPLQTGSVSGASGAVLDSDTSRPSAEEQIMSISFRYKVKVLSEVAQPAPNSKAAPRGPLIAIEGDDAEAVKMIGKWLFDELKNSDDLNVSLLDGPDVAHAGEGVKPMAQYHRLAAEWLNKSDEVLDAITLKQTAIPVDSAMTEAGPSSTLVMHVSRQVDENYDESDDESKDEITRNKEWIVADKHHASSDSNENMDVDKTPTLSKPVSLSSAPGRKSVGIIANYSLHASNVFACRIPVTARDNYSPSDHWNWMATQWRSIIGPDLTIFLKDSMGENGKPTVEMLEEGNLFVVKRTRGEGNEGLGLEPSLLRRVGFETCEWVRAFGKSLG